MNIGERFKPHKRFHGIFVPEDICKYRSLSPGAKLVYGRLCRYSGEDGKTYPATATLAAEVGISERQAREYIQELERGKFIEVDRENKHYRKDGSGGTNTYFFLWHAAFLGDRGAPRNAPPLRQSAAGVPRQSTAALTPAVDCRQRESELQKESVEESQAAAGGVGSTLSGKERRQADKQPTNLKTDSPAVGGPAAAATPSSPAPNTLAAGNAVTSTEKHSVEQKKNEFWTVASLQQVGRVTAELIGDEPKKGFAESAELAANGAPVSDVISLLRSIQAADSKPDTTAKWENFLLQSIRNAFSPAERLHLAEHPAAPRPEHQAEPEAMNRGLEALEEMDPADSLVSSYRCKCGAEIRQYASRVVGTCICRRMANRKQPGKVHAAETTGTRRKGTNS